MSSTIIRAPRPQRGWTDIQNTTLRDTRLSYRARGVLVRLLSNADGYSMTAADLANESPREGREAVLAALKELRAAGYIVVQRSRDAAGRWRTVTYVYDVPQTSAKGGSTEVGSTEVGSTEVGLADSGEPDRREKEQVRKEQEKEHKKDHPLERERGPSAPVHAAKPRSLSGGSSRSRYRTDPNTGISLEEGNVWDTKSLAEIRQHSPEAIEAAVAAAAAADPSGKAYPTSVLRLLRSQQRTASPASPASGSGPAWAAVAAPAAPREIDITPLGETL